MKPTKEQQEVIDHFEGALMVESSAGSGKTSTLTGRFVKLIQRGVNPQRILAITFTNKASNNMKEKISQATGLDAKSLHIFTFHAFCIYWLRKRGSEVGWPKLAILPPYDANKMVEKLCKKRILYKNDVKSKISKGMPLEKAMEEALTRELENPAIKQRKLDIVSKALNVMGRNPDLSLTKIGERLDLNANECTFISKVIGDYKEAKRKKSKMDFDDCLYYGLQLFRKSNVKHEYDFVMGKFHCPLTK